MVNIYRRQSGQVDYQKGFTIIELIIATAVFSVVLLIATVAVISLTSAYVKGDTQAETQDTARSVLSTVTQDIQFNQASSINKGTYNGQYGFFCIGNDTYFYQTNKEITSSNPHALLEFTSGSCPTVPTSPLGWTSGLLKDYITDLGTVNLDTLTGGGQDVHELLAQNLALGQLSITQIAGTQSYTISLNVVYGDIATPHQNPPSVGYYTYDCPPASLGGQFCATSSLTTTITPRIQ
jgi:prepilin-type N-terminal cleavage/methylation domain-containing protein